jgi:trehalose synthase-fused probable maltokinase
VTGARKGLLFDAWLDDRFARALLETIEREEETRTRLGDLRGQQTAAFGDVRGDRTEELRITRMSVEQSNTSIVYGDRLILKLFRRIEPGIHPDFEIASYLTNRAGFDRVPSVTAALHYERPGNPSTTLAMMQRLVKSQGDGWAHATDELSRFYDQVAGSDSPSLAPQTSFGELILEAPPKRIQDVMGGYLRTAETLGRRSAELHLALASDANDPAFSPEPFTRDDLAAVAADAAEQATRALETLRARVIAEQSAAGIPADVARRAGELVQWSDRLLDAARSGPPLEFTTAKIRVHGDYHLGQVLWAEGDFYILDFEGEPTRPLAERRAKQSPFKDVAGMLRSFSYAAYAALFAHVAARPADFPRLESWARIWQTWAMASFLRGYFHKAGGAIFLPAVSSQRDALLRFFMLNKALYELNYELNNRPEWVRIPLWGVFDLIQ